MSDGPIYRFLLYVAGDAPNSALARKNLNILCEEHLAGRHEIEVIDVYQQPARALADRIFMTPTLHKLEPPPARAIEGALGNMQVLLLALDLAAP